MICKPKTWLMYRICHQLHALTNGLCWTGFKQTVKAARMVQVAGGHWLVQMEWHPAGWSVSASVNLPCTIKSRSSLLAPAHLGGPGKRAIKRLWCGGWKQQANIYEWHNHALPINSPITISKWHWLQKLPVIQYNEQLRTNKHSTIKS